MIRERGWLQKQLDSATAEVKTWPAWMQKVIAEDYTPGGNTMIIPEIEMARPPTLTTLAPGQTAELTRTVSQRDIVAFAAASQDLNPAHLDHDFAATTRFKRPIAHGMLAASLISAVLGTRLPGPGTIYLSQSLVFRKPVFVGDTITAKVEVKYRMSPDRPNEWGLRTWVENQDGKTVLQGEAVVLYEPPQ